MKSHRQACLSLNIVQTRLLNETKFMLAASKMLI
uniref:Uncharacterized protein n=1 Tax=Rhizophora mucronata TaxID=61149 RepID=A0A2P2QHW7_RHIMU